MPPLKRKVWAVVKLCAPLNLRAGQKNEIFEIEISKRLKRGTACGKYGNKNANIVRGFASGKDRKAEKNL